MFDGLRRKVGLSYSHIHFRKSNDKMVNFTGALTRSRRALVIFPEIPPDGESILTLFKYLIRKFSSEGIMVLIRDDQLYSMASTPPLRTLTYTSDDVNTWFLPRRRLLQRITANTYDVALDLNIGLSLTGAFLCRASNAPLRVSFAKQNGDRFYNLLYQSKTTTGITHIYKNFLNCLDMF